MSIRLIILFIAACLALFYLAILFSPAINYRQRWFRGIVLHLVFTGAGALILYQQDIRHNRAWIGNFIDQKPVIMASLDELPVERERSLKAIATIHAVYINHRWTKAKGKVLIYFHKETIHDSLSFGSRIIFSGDLQPIANTGNPGSFDYRQYCGFQDIYHEVFLSKKNYCLAGKQKDQLGDILYATKTKILSIINRCVPGKKEAGVAEALLIGYRNDLDRDLVQAYSNTGVVHIIAISGLHLGMIYGLLIGLFSIFPAKKINTWVRPFVILFVLWGFSLLTGAAASILRSAVMFTFIVVGESLGRRTNVYNTLAASAFFLLLYDPYFLWDAGFMLSYTAVLSIVIFMKPIYRRIHVKNKLLDHIWQLNAVTLSAQVLTLPVVLFYFHQFPNLFLFTNGIAVPLSGLILYVELVLLLIYPVPMLNKWTGNTCSLLIAQMNGYIERTAHLPHAVTSDIPFSVVDAICLYIVIGAFAYWLLKKSKGGFFAGMISLLLFLFSTCFLEIKARMQRRLIVYNIPKHSAIDIITGKTFRFIGDSGVNTGRNAAFYLRPARVLFRAAKNGSPKGLFLGEGLIAGHRKTILVINRPLNVYPVTQKPSPDIIIISGNPRIRMSELKTAFNCTQYVFDSSNPLWKIRQWKKDADSLHLRHHSTSEQGAFEVDL